MTKQELIDKATKLMVDARNIMIGETVTAEQRTQVDAMLADAENFRADARRLEALEAVSLESTRSIPRGTPGDAATFTTDNRSADERNAAANKAIRSYLKGERFDTRSLTVTSDGVLIPTGVVDAKIARKSPGNIYDVVQKLKTATGEPVKLPLINDTANQFVLNSSNISTTDPSISSVTISIDDLRMNPILIDNSLLQDSQFDLVSYVADATITRYGWSVSSYISVGDGVNIQGLNTITANVTSSSNAAITYSDFVALGAALEPAYQSGAVFVMNNTTLMNQVMNIKDTAGRPIFAPFLDGGNSGFAGTILGYPVKINQYQANFGSGNICVQFGNFQQGYTLREVVPSIDATFPGATTVGNLPVVLRRLGERYAELNQTGFVAFARVGGAVTDAGTHPIQNLVGHA
jgi:HK97 family phage major capsid protein